MDGQQSLDFAHGVGIQREDGHHGVIRKRAIDGGGLMRATRAIVSAET